MSKIGRQPVIVPDGVQVELAKGIVNVKGEKGDVSQLIPRGVEVVLSSGKMEVKITKDSSKNRALWGTIRSLLDNMVVGVKDGWVKNLEVVGTGYRAEMVGENLQLALGFSHLIKITPPPGIVIEVENNEIAVRGADKQKVGQVAAQIRNKRPPDPYKGKGVRYKGEVIKLKPGKAAKTSEA